MATVANKSYPFREYPWIICDTLTVATLNGTTVSGSTALGVPVGGTFSPPTGSASGSLVASVTMKVNITGSTYYVQLWK
jgi:hypothetical protein